MTRIRLIKPRRSPTRRVFDQLAERIRAGRLAPGARLPTEQQLAAAAGVSRTVVREAVAALRAEGLVVTRQGAGTFVAADAQRAPFRIDTLRKDTLAELLDVMELRRAVEIESAGLAAERASGAQLERLAHACAAIEAAAGRGEAAVSEDLAFHLGIAEATGNPQFIRFLRFLGHHVIPRRNVDGLAARFGGRQSYLGLIQKEHRRVLEAIRSRDPQAARRAMRSHLTRSLERYRRLAGAADGRNRT